MENANNAFRKHVTPNGSTLFQSCYSWFLLHTQKSSKSLKNNKLECSTQTSGSMVNVTPTYCGLTFLITNKLVGTKTFSCNTFVNRVKTGET